MPTTIPFVTSLILSASGVLSWWAAVPVHVVLAYLAFTPAHEAGHGNVAGRIAGARGFESAVGTSSCSGKNYHLLHHLYPRMPFYEYASCFQEVRPVLEVEGSRITRRAA